MSEENMQETQQVEAVNPQQDPSTQTSEAETQEVHEQDQNQTPIETDQERNWRALRSSKEETD